MRQILHSLKKDIKEPLLIQNALSLCFCILDPLKLFLYLFALSLQVESGGLDGAGSTVVSVIGSAVRTMKSSSA